MALTSLEVSWRWGARLADVWRWARGWRSWWPHVSEARFGAGGGGRAGAGRGLEKLVASLSLNFPNCRSCDVSALGAGLEKLVALMSLKLASGCESWRTCRWARGWRNWWPSRPWKFNFDSRSQLADVSALGAGLEKRWPSRL